MTKQGQVKQITRKDPDQFKKGPVIKKLVPLEISRGGVCLLLLGSITGREDF